MEEGLLKQRSELRHAIADCKARKLSEAAKWAATQLHGMRKPEGPERCPPRSETGFSELTDVGILDSYELAISHFDSREYASSADILGPIVEARNGDASIDFLYFYSLYLRVHKDHTARSQRSNKDVAADLNIIQSKLMDCNAMGELDGFLLYLLGLISLDKDDLKGARGYLTRSIEKYPCNWSVWKALLSACPAYSDYNELILPDHFMTNFFRAGALVEFQKNEEALAILFGLSQNFPQSDALVLTIATAQNNLQNYDEAQMLFEDLLERNPNRIQAMDMYSNILYVKEDQTSLSALARRLAEQDPYRPETCCVIGNYYSFRGQHEKAVVYFKRALKLDPNFLPALTLTGHEFVELKNPAAAIEAYRKAVYINPKDYRAWYGLGQTYELVNMPYYALHYYGKAVVLRPNDARMWNALGHCYSSQALWQVDSAIRCYKRALPYDKEGVALRRLASLHSSEDKIHEAAKYYQMILQRAEDEGLASREDAAEAIGFLANYHRKTGDLKASQAYYKKLLDYGMPQLREVAKLSLREIQDMIGVSASSPELSTPGSAQRGSTPHPPR